MTGKDLFDGMSYVDERFIDEAENKTLPKRIVSPWIKVASMVACLCLILFGIHHLLPPENPGSAEDTSPNGIVSYPKAPQAPESNTVTPGDVPNGEVPSVILYVDEMTEIGFIGTVTELTDTDIFEIGMELNVVVADGTRHETADGNPSTSADSKTDYSGRYVMVQFIEYDRETGTIVVNMMTEVPTEKGG